MPFTPGPWEVRGRFYIGRPGRMSLAEVKAGDVPAEDVAQHEANARLIAASPALLAACKEAELLSEHADGCPWWKANISELQTPKQRAANDAKCTCHLKALRAAIALAENSPIALESCGEAG